MDPKPLHLQQIRVYRVTHLPPQHVQQQFPLIRILRRERDLDSITCQLRLSERYFDDSSSNVSLCTLTGSSATKNNENSSKSRLQSRTN